jgi:hypothetical protein
LTVATGTAPLPTFLIIGAQKSATRWLRTNLGEHPDVFAAERELRFFHAPQRFAERGTDWYRAQFEGWAGEPIVGEATPGYMMWRHDPDAVAARIQEVVPEVRLLALLRDPVDRALSAMVHHIKFERLPARSRLLDLARRTDPATDPLGLVAGGWYARSLAPYVRRFGDQLLVLLHDDIALDARHVYVTALRHVGASDDFVPDELEQVRFSASGGPSGESSRRPAVTPEERIELYDEFFRDEVRELERLLDLDLARWDPARRPPGTPTEPS